MAEGVDDGMDRTAYEREGVTYEPSWRVQPKRDRLWVHLLLFLATGYTTTHAGMWMSSSLEIAPDTAGWEVLIDLRYLAHGLPFSISILAILGIHEMGHYLASRRWHVRASLPYFIPFYSIIGTLGAVIKMRSRIPNRRALIDIGAAGPLAGFVVAVAALGLGLHLSDVVAKSEVPQGALTLGDSILSAWMGNLIIGELAENQDVMLHPVAFAGWLGLLVTVLNLLPVGQFDGGHIVYAIFGRRHALISKATMAGLGLIWALGPPYDWIHEAGVASAWIGSRWPGWLVWMFLAMILGRRHPPPGDPYTELNSGRKAVGYLALVIFVLCFVPRPLSFVSH